MSNRILPTSLPKELQEIEINCPTLISWVFQINETSVFEDYKRTQHVYKKHFYWEKNNNDNKNITLYGFNSSDIFYEGIISNSDSILGTGPIQLIANPFDSRNNSQEGWQDLNKKIAYLPRLLRTEMNEKQYITLNFLITNHQELITEYSRIIEEFNEFILIESSLKKKHHSIISKKEIHVEDWMKAVDESILMLKNSSVLNKIVLARQLELITDTKIDVTDVLANLRQQQPNTYRFSIRENNSYFIGASPERLLESTPLHFATVCVAGSIERGKTETEDNKLGEALLKDTKNIIEHSYVVQWLTKEMSALTTKLEPLSKVKLLRNRDIQHLYLPIYGKKRQGVSFKEGIEALHPSPALGGLPKQEAMDWIKNHEVMPRGLYGGPLGWVNLKDDTGEVIVGIRSGFISKNKAILYAGCGIVESSNSELERKETKVKFQPMLRALGGMLNE